MEMDKTKQPNLGTWTNLPTEEIEKKPKVIFDINISITSEFLQDEPREYQGENGAYYIFPVKVDNEEKVIMTSAWSLLKALKINSPLKGKTLVITKRLIKGKQTFEVK